MSNLTAEIILNMGGNLASKAKQYGASMNKFAQQNSRAMTTVRASTIAAGKALDGIANKYTGLLSGAAVLQSVRGVAGLDAKMTRIGTNAQLSEDQVAKLKQSIFEIANQDDIRIDVDQLANAVDALLTDTGDFDFMFANLRNMAVMLQATGSAAEDVGMVMGAMQRKNVGSQEEVNALMDRFIYQMSLGSVSIKEAASEARQLFSLYQGQGPEAMTQLFGLLQMFVNTTGSASEAVTSLDAVFSTFRDGKKINFLNARGIEVFKKGTKELREPMELFLDILNAAQDDAEKLSLVFEGTALKGLTSLFGTENKAKLEQMISGTYRLGIANQSAARNAATFDSTMDSLLNVWKNFSDDTLANPIKAFSDALNSIDRDTLKALMEAGVWLGGGILGYKAIKGGKNFAQEVWNDAKGMGKGADNSSPMADLFGSGVTPVYVVNMGQGDLMDTAGGQTSQKTKPKATKATKPSTKFNLPNIGSALSFLSKATAGAGTTYAMAEGSEWAADKLYKGTGLDQWAKEHSLNIDSSIVPAAPKFEDVWSEIKEFLNKLPKSTAPPLTYLTGEYPNQPSSGYPAISQDPNGRLDLVITDERVKVKKFQYRGMTLGVDSGITMLD